MPMLADVAGNKTVPITFMSRKMMSSQQKTWTTQEKEVYAVVKALKKWAGWIGHNPVLDLTDHHTLESWANEILEDLMGPSGCRARWHLKLGKFWLTVKCTPGKDNVVADGLGRWANPTSQAGLDA